jgi:hypothetical protein
VGDGPQRLHALFMTLSHSRRTVAVWSFRQEQLAWHRCHNEAFKRIEGIPAVNRVDNLKTGVASGAGANAVINEAYRRYARAVGFHIDPCQARSPRHKGKVERHIGVKKLRRKLDPRGKRFHSLEDLQAWTDRRFVEDARRRVCPATGKSVWESWEAERSRLRPLPILPEPFDIAVTRPVHDDCLVYFEGRSYQVPYRYWRQRVEVRGCASTVQIVADGRVVVEYSRHTRERILLKPELYDEPEATDVRRPLPLGKMGRRLQEICQMPVSQRPVDLYAALAEVAR